MSNSQPHMTDEQIDALFALKGWWLTRGPIFLGVYLTCYRDGENLYSFNGNEWWVDTSPEGGRIIRPPYSTDDRDSIEHIMGVLGYAEFQ